MKSREPFLRELTLNLFLYFCKPHLGLSGLQLTYLGCVLRSIGVHIREGEILEVALHSSHTETVGNRRVNLQSLKRNALPLWFRDIFECLHIMFAVRELHDEHANVARGGDQEATQTLGGGSA